MVLKYPKFDTEYAEKWFRRVEFAKIGAQEEIEKYLKESIVSDYEVKYMRENEDTIEFFMLKK